VASEETANTVAKATPSQFGELRDDDESCSVRRPAALLL